MILPLLLALLTAGLSLGQTADNTSIVDDNSSIEAALDMNATLPLNESTPVNGTENATAVAVNLTPAISGPNLNYIWQFSGIETGPIIMVLEQNGSDLFGRAKYEPESGKAWNADVIGSVVGEKVDLTMSALKDNVLIITRFSGILANEDISGNFTQASEVRLSTTAPSMPCGSIRTPPATLLPRLRHQRWQLLLPQRSPVPHSPPLLL